MNKVLFLGDSITDQNKYFSIIDTALRLNGGEYELFNLGLSSENVSGLTEAEHPFPRPNINDRVDKILDVVKPDAVIALYGINDGIYQPFSEERFKIFQEGYLKFIKSIKERNIFLAICSPPCFDKFSCKSKLFDIEGESGLYREYNDVMQKYAQWLREISATKADMFIDVFGFMCDTIKANRERNKTFLSGDGIHPNFEMSFALASPILTEFFKFPYDAKTLYKCKYFLKHYNKNFKLNNMKHSNIKEFVGHSSPYKNKVTSAEKLVRCENSYNKFLKKTIKYPFMVVKTDKHKGFARLWGEFEGRRFFLSLPNKENAKNKLVWRTEFYDAFADVDYALLGEGYHAVYLEMPNLYGLSEAKVLMERFYNFIVPALGVEKKVGFIALSRGGQYAINFASSHPESVDFLWLDAPVINLASWPLGKEGYDGDANAVIKFLGAKNIDEARELADKHCTSILDKMKKQNYPVLLFSADNDEVVPYEENGKLIKEIFAEKKDFLLQIKRQDGHHPHGAKELAVAIKFLSQLEK